MRLGTVTNGLQSGRTKAGAKLTLGVPTSPTLHSGRQYPLGITQCHYQDGLKSWYWGEGKVCDERLAFEQIVVSSISEGLVRRSAASHLRCTYRDIMKSYERNMNILVSLELCDNDWGYILKRSSQSCEKIGRGRASGGWALEAGRREVTLPWRRRRGWSGGGGGGGGGGEGWPCQNWDLHQTRRLPTRELGYVSDNLGGWHLE